MTDNQIPNKQTNAMTTNCRQVVQCTVFKLSDI